jgi:hypothetical protein
MNQQSPLIILFIVGAVLSGLLVVLSVLTGGGNEVGHLCKFMLIAVAVFGLIAPRNGILLLLFICAYIDTVKRLMAVSGRVSQMDLYYVLGIPPVLLSSVTASIIIAVFVGKLELKGHQWRLLFIAIGFVATNAGLSFLGGNRSIGGLLPVVANSGSYALLLFLIPVLFQQREDIERLIKRIIWIFLPVAIYGVLQKIFGYQEFEIAYLKTGISIEAKQLLDNDFRPFSTLNSNTALTTVCGFLAPLSFTAMFISTSTHRRSLLPPSLALPLTLIFSAGIVASTGRSGIAVAAFTFLGCWCFRSLNTTRGMYAVIVTLFASLIIFSNHLIEIIGPLQMQISNLVGDEGYAEQMTRLGTYTDRLVGYYNLMTNPAMWSLFGHSRDILQDYSLYSHDLFTNALVRYGVVPVLGISIVAIFLLIQLHRTVLRITDRSLLAIAAAMTAIMISSVLVSLLFGSVMGVFPINLLIYTMGGILMLAKQLYDTTIHAPVEHFAEAGAAQLIRMATPSPAPTATAAATSTRRAHYPFTRTGKTEAILPRPPQP